ncbi:MAG: PC4/YdbC family ssDNA-binding protein [Maricaulis sp.]|nr:PC4/YdbC family ssDNA-binding protein [Maricaulis sp.]
MTTNLPVLIDQWERSNREVIRVQLTEFNGNKLIEARIFHQQYGDEFVRTYKGLSLGLKHFPRLLKALTEADLVAAKLNLKRD